MANRQKRVSQKEIKRETETTDVARFIDKEVSVDEEMSEPHREEKKRLMKESPSKVSNPKKY